MPHRLPRSRTTLLAATALCLGALPGQSPDPWATFQQKNAHDQERIHARLRAEIEKLDSPWLRSLRACAQFENGQPRNARLPAREPKKHPPAPPPSTDPWFPALVEYHFGLGVIEPPVATKDAGKTERAAASHRVPVHAALEGMVPDADQALASLLRRMDTDTSADHFAVFLESWRNGPESFYQALDRTAGTPASVFFYDAMLSDFVSDAMAHKVPGTAELRSLQAQHDALHEAFLAYRQYRAFREAVAFAMVLPPARKLPARLQRYEEKPKSGYSLREQVLMVLAVENFDAGKVAGLVVASAAPLPKPLWGAPYEPHAAWTKVFAERIDRMIEAEGGTDVFLTKTRQRLEDWSTAVRNAAIGSVTADPMRGAR